MTLILLIVKVTLQFSAKHVDMDMEQSTQPILHIYFLTQLLFGYRTESAAKFISLMPEKFDLTRHSSKVHGVTVNGVYLKSTATTVSTSQTTQVPSSLTAVSGVTAPSGSRLPFLHSVTSRKKKLKVKFVHADITYSGNSHPIFTNITAMFVNLMNDNADLNSMMALVRSEYGPNFTIVGMMVCRLRIVSIFFMLDSY